MEQLPDCELEVMLVIWEEGERVPQPLIKQRLEERHHRVYGQSTLYTWLTRLRSRGMVSCVIEKKISYYTPLVKREDYENLVVGDLMEQLFGGQMPNLFAALTRAKPLSEADRARIKEITDGWDC